MSTASDSSTGSTSDTETDSSAFSDTDSSVSSVSNDGSSSSNRKVRAPSRKDARTDAARTTEEKPSLGRRVSGRSRNEETDESYQRATDDPDSFISDELSDTGFWDDYQQDQDLYSDDESYKGYTRSEDPDPGYRFTQEFYDDPTAVQGNERLKSQSLALSESFLKNNPHFTMKINNTVLEFIQQSPIRALDDDTPVTRQSRRSSSRRSSRPPPRPRPRPSRDSTRQRQTDNSRYESDTESDTASSPPARPKRQPPREETTDRRQSMPETTESRAPAPSTTQSQAPITTGTDTAPSRPAPPRNQAPTPTTTDTQTSTPPTTRSQAPTPTTDTQTSTPPTTQSRAPPGDTRTGTVQDSDIRPRNKLRKPPPTDTRATASSPPTDFSDFEGMDTASQTESSKPPKKSRLPWKRKANTDIAESEDMDTAPRTETSKKSKSRLPWKRKPKLDESLKAYDGTAKSDWLDGGYDPNDTRYESQSDYRDKILLAYQAAQHAVHSRYEDENGVDSVFPEAAMSIAEKATDMSVIDAEGSQSQINDYYDAVNNILDDTAEQYGLRVKNPNLNIAGRVRHALASESPGLTISTPAGREMLSSVLDSQKDTAVRSQLMRDLNTETLSLMNEPGDESRTLEDRVGTALHNLYTKAHRK